ncbi:hypothetical protein [Williamsia deligens]|uniref:Signal transduction histidine kinase n=1 Tax=Williamsia deligens TaxID=321325 RepID=A0ABW3G281_9NOCA|nr:hypothetical protein [Williamsia deligens]MCP2194476.1 hypothetical protein [Williamsia deligens]
MLLIDETTPRDARALIGMHTPAARLVVGIYLVCIIVALLYVVPKHPITVIAMVAALTIAASATIALLAVRDDPLPGWTASAMAAAPATACALILGACGRDVPAPVSGWSHGIGTMVLAFMCVRGRTGRAWVGMAAMVAVYMVHSTLVGDGPLHRIDNVLIDLGPLVMATVFSLTLRPGAKLVFDLRDAGRRRSAELAAAQAAGAERDAQLRELDRLVRPMLNRIAAGDHLDDVDRTTCRLLEAHLRDRLRAPGLDTPAIADAARAARARGVEVILLDDSGMPDAFTPDARAHVTDAVVDALVDAVDGDVRVRLLPPGRAAAASVIVHDHGGVRRLDLDSDGRVCATRN